MFSYQSANFTLDGTTYDQETILKMQLFTNFVDTGSIPDTLNIINSVVPSVLTTECFNEGKLPFSEEIKQTEIGHLFEHIVLALMCEEKITKGEFGVCFEGTTDWDWDKDDYGSFIITIKIGREEVLMIQKAVAKAIEIIEKIIGSASPQQTGSLSPSYLPVPRR